MIDPPDPTRERDHSLRATTHRVTVTRPRPNRGWIEGRIVIDMVQLRTLTSGDHTHFPLWISDLGGEPVLQTNGLSERLSVFGRFWTYHIVPNFTNFYQKCAAKGMRTGSNRQLTRAFSRPTYLKRVKSGGSCQPVISAPFFQGSREVIAKELPTERRRGTEKNGKRWETKGTFMSSSFSSLCLRAAAVDSSRQTIDSTMIVITMAQSKKPRHAEFKGLNSQVSRERRATFSGFAGRAKRGEGNLLILQCLLAKGPRRTGEDFLNLKDLLAVLPPSYRAIFSGLVGRRKRGGDDLLIPQGLSAQLPRRTDGGMLNLKDLLTGFPPSLRRLFEDEPVWRRFLATKSYQILPFSTKNVRRTGSNRQVNGG